MMGLRVKPSALKEIIEEVDEDGSGYLEFEEFCQLSAKFLVEEDEEGMKKELREAFRIYDKVGMRMMEEKAGLLKQVYVTEESVNLAVSLHASFWED